MRVGCTTYGSYGLPTRKALRTWNSLNGNVQRSSLWDTYYTNLTYLSVHGTRQDALDPELPYSVQIPSIETLRAGGLYIHAHSIVQLMKIDKFCS